MKDSVVTCVGSTFINRLVIQNTSSQKQEYTIAIQIPQSVQLLSTVPEQLDVLPGETAIIPIKGLVNHQAMMPVDQISLHITDQIGRVVASKSFILSMQGRDRSALTLYTPEETVVLFTSSEPARLPLRLVHNRLKAGKFFIEATSFPAGIDRSSFPILINLVPNQDTALLLVVNSLHRWLTNKPYQISVTIRDEQKSVVGNVVYKVVVAVADKQYEKASSDGLGNYGASMALATLNTNQWARETRVWGSDSIGKAQVDFNIDYLNYGSDHVQQLQNSFVSVRTRSAMVRLGSIYDFHELPLFGRGAKVTINQPDYQWTFWAINSNQNWLSANTNSWDGNTFSVRYDRQLQRLPRGSFSLSSNYYTQPTISRAGYLNFASFQYEQPERHLLQLLGGQSAEFARSGTDRAQTFGWSGQLNYTYQSPKVGFQLRSYLSNPFYAGIQRGATLLYSQFFWQPSPKTVLLARLNHIHYNRASFTTPTDYYNHVFGNTVAEVSVSHRLQAVSLSLRPYWYSQSDYANPYSQRADAYRLAPSLSFRRRPYQSIDISYDIGMLYDRTSIFPQSGFFSQRLVSSIMLGSFKLWGYWQKGPYYLFDLRSDRPAQFTAMSITPTIDFGLFNRKLIGSIGVNYLYDDYLKTARYIAVGRLQYDVTPTLAINFLGNGTPYSPQPESAYSLYRLQVTKLFHKIKSKQRTRLQLSFFEDINGNGTKDSDERWVDGLLVTVHENTLLTDEKGSITYRNLPPGTYTVSAMSTGRLGDPVLYHEDVAVTGSVKKVIPLTRTFKVNGQLQCQASAYDHQPCQFDRFVVDIERDSQKISSITLLPDGSFALHLAPGTYTVSIRDMGRQTQPTVKTASFTLTETGQYTALNWVVDGSTRPIEIKRFKQH